MVEMMPSAKLARYLAVPTAVLALSLSLTLSAAAALAAPAAAPVTQTTGNDFTYSDLLAAIKAKQVVSAHVNDLTNKIQVELRDGRKLSTDYPSGDSVILQRLAASGAQVTVVHDAHSAFWWLPYVIAGPLLIIALAVFVLIGWRNWRTTRGGRNKASDLTKDIKVQAPQTRFADVAGIDEAVEELMEMVDFLLHPEKYARLGARMPSAVMLYGPPGTGKTLLAKALAGEAQVPFYAVSGSEFVEMYVGVGARRMRQLFKKARAHKEGAVIFIDEIDAIGRARGASNMSTNDERDQTLNQLLVELDGFGTSARVIVVAATNRLDVLDPALLRPGRFGRQIAVDLPSEAGRGAILGVHSQGKPIDAGVDLSRLARVTGGLSGAQLAEVVNEAAIMAAREGRSSINQGDFDEGTLRVLMGPEKKSSMLAEGELEVIAYHEAGHVLTAELCPTHEKAQRATVRPRGRAAGLALYGRTDRALQDADYIHEQMVCALGGRAAEQTVFGKVSTGASNDLAMVNQIARRAIEEFGMSELVGQVVTQQGESNQRISEESLALIDQEMARVVNQAYQDALRLLDSHRPQLDKLAQLLLSQGDLERVDIAAVIEGVQTQPLSTKLAQGHTRKEPAPLPKPQVIQQPFARRGLVERALARGLEWVSGRRKAGL
jgi:cell division protease FtsH